MNIERDGGVTNQKLKTREEIWSGVGGGKEGLQNACTNISADIPALRFEVEVMNESHHGPWVGGCPLE